MPKFIASIDQGTTSTRCILFDHSGQVCTVAQKEHQQIYPKPGWVEHDPLEIWQRTREVVSEVISKTQIRPGDIAAIGITNQRETSIVWNKDTGVPYYNAIVWQDARTKEICDQLTQDVELTASPKVGLPVATYFSGPKIQWILENVPEALAAARAAKQFSVISIPG
jgi:glycerol kinase